VRIGYATIVVLLGLCLGASQAKAQSATISVSPTSLRFTSQGTGVSSAPKSVKLTNRGAGALTVTRVEITGPNAAEFRADNACVAPLATRESCSLSITMNPRLVGTQTATLIITTSAGTTEISLGGTSVGPKLSLSPRSVKFAKQFLDTPAATQVVRVSNTGKGVFSWVDPVLRGAQASDFSVSDDCAGELQPREACSIFVSFAPTAGGERTAELVLANGLPEAAVLTISGSAIAPTPKVKLSPTRVAFGQVGIGATAARAVQLTSTGDAPLRVIDAEVALDSQTLYGIEWSCSDELDPGETCLIELSLTPEVAGDLQTNLTVVTNAGTSLIPITAKAVGPTPRVSPTSVKFTKQAVGEVSDPKVVTLGNSGVGLLQVRTVTLRGEHSSDFRISNTCGEPIEKSGSCEIAIAFAPSAAGERNAIIEIVDNAGSRSIAASGLGAAPTPKISASPTRIGFSKQGTGTESDPRIVVLRNTGDGTLRIETITPQGGDAADFRQSNTCGDPIAPGDSCEIELIFKPSAEGSKNISLEVRSNAGLLAIPVTGTAAAAAIRVSPSNLKFNSLAVGESSDPRTLIVTNRGLGVLEVRTVTPAGDAAADWILSNTCGDPLFAGEACEISVIWRPMAGGVRSGQVVIKSNAGDIVIPLSGSAVAPEPKSTFSPTRLSFGSQGVGLESAPRIIQVSSTGTDALRVQSVTLLGAARDDYQQSNDCGAPIEPGDVCSIELIFAPVTAGDKALEVVVRTNAGEFRVPVSGRAEGPKISISPTRLSFPAQSAFSTSTPRVLTVKNTGRGVFALSAIAFLQNDEQSFEFESDCPNRLEPGDACSLSLTFRPKAPGSKVGALRLTGNTDATEITLGGIGRESALPSGKFDETRWDESTWTPE
jgi:hypothetical protein